jgi:hypothetical protein
LSVAGVELFFNVPRHSSPSLYTYHTVTVAAQYQIVSDATQTVQQVECTADFLGQLKLFLNTGWKLVDICIDSSAIARGLFSHVIELFPSRCRTRKTVA